MGRWRRERCGVVGRSWRRRDGEKVDGGRWSTLRATGGGGNLYGWVCGHIQDHGHGCILLFSVLFGNWARGRQTLEFGGMDIPHGHTVCQEYGI